MENSYQKGKKLCEEIFYKTGDIRYFNMSRGFEKLANEKL